MTLDALIEELKRWRKADKALGQQEVVFWSTAVDEEDVRKYGKGTHKILQKFEIHEVSMEGNNDTGERQVLLSDYCREP